jgi:type IV pilus assembly protein PilB
LLPAAFCRQRKVTPLSNNDRVFRLAIVDPLDYFTIQDVEFRIRKQVACVVTDESTLEDLIQKIYGKRLEPDSPTVAPETAAELEMRGEDENYDLGNEAALASNANMPPVVKLVNQFIGRAVKSGASDIHVEPQKDFLQVRQRVDGNLQDLMRIPRDLQDATLSRLKIMAGMDIADRRRPRMAGPGSVTMPSSWICVFRPCPPNMAKRLSSEFSTAESSKCPLRPWGYLPQISMYCNRCSSLPQGMILVTGPTGSGKTSTLYTSLN